VPAGSASSNHKSQQTTFIPACPAVRDMVPASTGEQGSFSGKAKKEGRQVFIL